MNNNRFDWRAYKGLSVRLTLIVLIPFLMYFWGLAIFANFANFWNVFAPSGKTNFAKDLGNDLPVLAPILSKLPKAVKEAKLSLSGYSQEGLQIKVYLNDSQVATIRADKSGQFSFDGLALDEGDNEVFVKAMDSQQVESAPSPKVKVKYLKKPPFLELTNLGDNADLRQPTNIFTLTGKTEPGVSVTVNGSFVFVDNNGSFSFQLALSDGASVVTAIATDDAGNQAAITRNVTFTKQP